jgi:predicted TIM-barrel fold metal-dependent hydrolase
VPKSDPAGGLFDCHFHIIDRRFPLSASQDYLPDEFRCEDYLTWSRRLEIRGGAVVSGSFHGFDQSYLLDALARLGPGFVGVTQLPASASDQEILRLDAAGVRAVRFNLRRGGSARIEDLPELAARVWELAGWHVELYADAALLESLLPTLLPLPKLAVDHLGLTRAGLPTVLELARHGTAIKASGFGRVDFDVRAALRAIAATNPSSLMFGTDLPSTRAPRPFEPDDIALVREALGDPLSAEVLAGNARRFYRLPSGERPA